MQSSNICWMFFVECRFLGRFPFLTASQNILLKRLWTGSFSSFYLWALELPIRISAGFLLLLLASTWGFQWSCCFEKSRAYGQSKRCLAVPILLFGKTLLQPFWQKYIHCPFCKVWNRREAYQCWLWAVLDQAIHAFVPTTLLKWIFEYKSSVNEIGIFLN